MRSLILVALVLVGCGDETNEQVAQAVAAANESACLAPDSTEATVCQDVVREEDSLVGRPHRL